MRHAWLSIVALTLSACAGEAAQDAGEPIDAGADRTELTVWSQLPGAYAAVAGQSVRLDADGQGVIVIEPAIRESSATLTLDRDAAQVELPFDWSLDLEYTGLPSGTALQQMTLIVFAAAEDGSCRIGMTNAVAAGRAWAAEYPAPIACGPFR